MAAATPPTPPPPTPPPSESPSTSTPLTGRQYVTAVIAVVVSAALLVTVGYIAGYAFRDVHLAQNPLLTPVLLFGAFGGTLYAMREPENAKLKFPRHEGQGVRPGFLADMAFGLAGALGLFLIVPTNNTQAWSLEVLALAVVGGYGGRALLPRLMENYVGQVEEALAQAAGAEEKAADAKVEAEAAKEEAVAARMQLADAEFQVAEARQVIVDKFSELASRAELHVETLELLNRHLEKGPGLPATDLATLIDNIGQSGPETRFEVFNRARDVRRSLWEGTEADKDRMQRTIPIFEALIATDPEGKFHRYRGQLGYVYKDQNEPDYTRALALLSQAIQLRDQTEPDKFPLYEFNRAICQIQLDPDFQRGEPSTDTVRDAVLTDVENCVRIAGQLGDHDTLNMVVIAPVEPLATWYEINQIDLSVD